MSEPILIISGTNRPGSNSLKIATLVKRHYDAIHVPADIFSLEQLPGAIFDPASYATKPAEFAAVQDRVLKAEGLHVVTPEYKGGVPGVLKYFIDMLKFPESIEHKPVALTGVAAGMWGALRPVEQLQLIFGHRNAHIYPERVFIPGIDGKLNADGTLNDSAIDGLLAAQAAGFAAFIKRLSA